MLQHTRSFGVPVLASLIICLSTAWGQAQPPADPLGDLPGLDFALPAVTQSSNPTVDVTAWWTAASGDDPARLSVEAVIPREAHIYSITQKEGGPVPSAIRLNLPAGVELAGDWKANPPPDAKNEPAFDNLLVESHHDRVVWTAAIKIPSPADALAIDGKLRYQLCDEKACYPPTEAPFTATRREAQARHEPAEEQPQAGELVEPHSQTRFSAWVSPAVAAPGDVVTLTLAVHPGNHWHIYPWAPRDNPEQKTDKATLIALTETSGLVAGTVAASQPPMEVSDDGAVRRYYEQAVEWSIPLTVPRDAALGQARIAGRWGYQLCSTSCLPPRSLAFEVSIQVADQAEAGGAPIALAQQGTYAEVAGLLAEVPAAGLDLDLDQIAARRKAEQPLSLAVVLPIAFLGGFVLNFMPCVLPVIGLKILSFVQQSGEHRFRVLLLNLWYSAGILFVFLILASLPAIWQLVFSEGFGWGKQFGLDEFNIPLTVLIFAMALSFLGVWEIPIPGFAGSGKLQESANREGYSAAFIKGMLITVLATPCIGPGVGTALSVAFSQPLYITYAIFTCMGLGMASPYLVIGAFPSLIRYLPRPGPWMDTFKQVMGFVLLGTVVYLLSLVSWAWIVPTVGLLIGVWAACWWIGRVPVYAETPAKVRAWLQACVIVICVGAVSVWHSGRMERHFQSAVDREIATRMKAADTSPVAVAAEREQGEHGLPWQPFSIELLNQLVKDQQTVMVDFTADWCINCKFLEENVLSTRVVRELVDEYGVVPLVVDVTHYPKAETELLRKLTGGDFVPVLAIFPAGRPNEPIVLIDLYTANTVRRSLEQAGPSKSLAGKTNHAAEQLTEAPHRVR